MLRRLAVFCLAVLPLFSACATQPLLSVGVRQVVVEPNPDSQDQRADIPYSVGTPAHVTVTLMQPDGKSIQLRDNDRAPDSYSLPFTGVVDVPNSNDKRVLPDGVYKLVFQARSRSGQTAEQIVDATVKNADPVPLEIGDPQVSLPTFSPNGQGVREINGRLVNLDQTTFNFSVSKSADMSLWVTDKDGNVTPIQSWLARDVKPGLWTFTWDGKGPSGIALKDGAYTFHIQASDKSGNVTEKTGTVTIVDSGTPEVQLVSAKFFPTALGLGGTVNVVITVKNTGDTAIKTLGPPPGTKYTTRMSYLDPAFNKPGDVSPPYVDTPGRWRVGVRWTSGPENYPARWGFFADDSKELMPGQEATVTGSIQILPPQSHDITFWATVERGGIGYTGDYGQTRITIGF